MLDRDQSFSLKPLDRPSYSAVAICLSYAPGW